MNVICPNNKDNITTAKTTSSSSTEVDITVTVTPNTASGKTATRKVETGTQTDDPTTRTGRATE